MNQESFEARLLHVWMTTRVSLTRPNILFLTRASRRKADRWLDAMVKEGVLDVDSDDEGELIWRVRGAARPARGAENIEDVLRLEGLRGEVHASAGDRARGSSSALTLPAGVSRALATGARGEKSLIASGLLSVVFGPLGWLYAGPPREALSGALVFFIALWFVRWIPLLSTPLVSLLWAGSGALGVLYAWQHNRNGRPTPLLRDEEQPRLPGRR